MFKPNKVIDGFHEDDTVSGVWEMTSSLNSTGNYDAHLSGSVSRAIKKEDITDSEWSNTMDLSFWFVEGDHEYYVAKDSGTVTWRDALEVCIKEGDRLA